MWYIFLNFQIFNREFCHFLLNLERFEVILGRVTPDPLAVISILWQLVHLSQFSYQVTFHNVIFMHAALFDPDHP